MKLFPFVHLGLNYKRACLVGWMVLPAVQSFASWARSGSVALAMGDRLAVGAHTGVLQVEWIDDLWRVAEFAIRAFGLASGALHDVIGPEFCECEKHLQQATFVCVNEVLQRKQPVVDEMEAPREQLVDEGKESVLVTARADEVAVLVVQHDAHCLYLLQSRHLLRDARVNGFWIIQRHVHHAT